MAKVGFMGLGVMGFPMAGHLATRGGHEVTVYNRSRDKAERWAAQVEGGKVADTPAQLAADQDVVFSCVGNDDDLKSVTVGPDGAFQSMKGGAIFVDHTTASAEVARELASTAEDNNFHFLDAPVSGGQAGAENGVLTVMVGGSPDAFERAQPVIASFAQQVTLIGPSGSGQLAKMVNQIAICGLLQGLSEAIHFAQAANLDLDKVMATISKGAAQSWQMDNRWRTMAKSEFEFGFAVNWMRKDLAICLAESERNGAKLDVTRLIDQYYADVQEMGGGGWDTSSLIARLKPQSA